MVDKAHRLTDESWKKLKSVCLPFILERKRKFSRQRMNKYFSKFAKQNEFKRNFWSKAKSQRKNIPSGTSAKDYR